MNGSPDKRDARAGGIPPCLKKENGYFYLQDYISGLDNGLRNIMNKNMFRLDHMNKLYLLFFLLLSYSLILCGCATVSPQQKQIWRETGPACFTKPDCDAKWAAARTDYAPTVDDIAVSFQPIGARTT